MIIDLHTHTYPLSDDSVLSPDELVEEAKRAGLDGVCLSEHDQFWDAETARALTRRHEFPVFPAAEINTEDGHLLVYGLERYVFGMHRVSFLRRLVDEAGGAMIVAHPYRRRYRHHDVARGHYERLVEHALQSEVFGCVEAVEAFNGRGRPEENAFALDLAARRGLACTGASDAHRRAEIGTFATRFQRRIETLDDLIAELRAGRFAPVVPPHPVATPATAHAGAKGRG